MRTPIDTKWVDIVPPAAPPSSVEPFVIVALMGVLLALIAAGIWFYRRPRCRNKRVLRRLARDLSGSRMQIKAACFQIRECVHTAFANHRLRSLKWAGVSDSDWQHYLDRLSQYCFAADVPAPAEVDGMIRETLVWLDQKVAGS